MSTAAAIEPRVLRLTLKKKWFDMIASGEKKEEYREIKQHWSSRLTKERVFYGNMREFDVVEFTNGYGADKPRIVFECECLTVDYGNTDWGAEEGEIYFVIKLGAEISRANFN